MNVARLLKGLMNSLGCLPFPETEYPLRPSRESVLCVPHDPHRRLFRMCVHTGAGIEDGCKEIRDPFSVARVVESFELDDGRKAIGGKGKKKKEERTRRRPHRTPRARNGERIKLPIFHENFSFVAKMADGNLFACTACATRINSRGKIANGSG